VDLSRTLLKENTPRANVLVVFWCDSTDLRVCTRVTDANGQFTIKDVDKLITGVYHLEYYGDGIVQTLWDRDGKEKILEDIYTPWEYDIQITNLNEEFDHTPPEGTVIPEEGIILEE